MRRTGYAAALDNDIRSNAVCRFCLGQGLAAA